MDVFLTVDTEVWCGGWSDLDRAFPDAFRRYVYGPTPRGDGGLPLQFRILREHGLTASFFVEPLFALRFGQGPLDEMVGMVRDAGQEVQLHLHTEWLDEAREPLFPEIREKRQFLYQFDLAQQTRLIRTGLDLVERAGAAEVNAFRAGSFGLGPETFAAVHAAGLRFDTSFDPTTTHPINAERRYFHPTAVDGVVEAPLGAFQDGLGRMRHVQLGACSLSELEGSLQDARARGWNAVILLSHNFELMNAARDRFDEVVVRRFEGLCRFLARRPQEYTVRGFAGWQPAIGDPSSQGEPARLPRAGLLATATRYAEQAARQLLWHRTSR
jgi:hypothetical protein